MKKTGYSTLQGLAIGLLANGLMPFFKGILELSSFLVIIIALIILWFIEL